jgi:hypothetical protein
MSIKFTIFLLFFFPFVPYWFYGDKPRGLFEAFLRGAIEGFSNACPEDSTRERAVARVHKVQG